ncbi:MAG: hypothetical protein OPY06_02045 [Nitrosopumilus sp.]|nr:hypothetical protein [Nitrosopumilus sp.]MDF2423288.1 hypothetical protein [Nitrosopumilus sp.]MDF2424497.1 hypothetical protein [Nitrosopumilus sp.]MDF2425200.1 hypothetical protein [Nitrosopumilus sp.]MDF2426877.1 hypothetical protein [Nitrosopumilus sp.]
MNKKIIMISMVVILVIVLVGFSSNETGEKTNILFHITLADPDLYVNGVYTEKFTLEKGEYLFRFVPNGSSPKILSITLSGDTFDYSEDFKLIGTSHQTGISEYFTWDYDGQKNIFVLEMQELSITINPNTETLGSVSVDILEN